MATCHDIRVMGQGIGIRGLSEVINTPEGWLRSCLSGSSLHGRIHPAICLLSEPFHFSICTDADTSVRPEGSHGCATHRRRY